MKKYFFTVLISVMTAITVCCQTNESGSGFNLNFETVSNLDGLPDGWFRWGMPSYSIKFDAEVKRSGRHSLRVEATEEIAERDFGCPAFSIPAIYEGRTVTVKALMKFENVEQPIGLLLRIDGSSGSLQFDNMQSRGIMGTQDWTEYSVTLPLPAEAKTIFIGAILSGKGMLWIDHFQVLIDNEDISKAKIKTVITFPAENDKEFDNGSGIVFPSVDERLISNLDLLGKLWGFLKYHHPEVVKGNYNWDYELFRILPAYLKAENHEERDKTLLDWINKYGEVPVCRNCRKTPSDAHINPDLSWAENSNMTEELKKKIQYIYSNRWQTEQSSISFFQRLSRLQSSNRHQGEHYYIKLVPNVRNPQFINENPYQNMPYPDAGFRLLALYRYWNMVHYFFPSTYLTDKNWNDVLKEYIPMFISAENRLEYELATIQVIGEINDTHAAGLGGGNAIAEMRGNRFAPFRVWFIEGKLVVTDYYNWDLKEAAGLKIGDIVTHINGESVETIIENLKKYYPASNEAARLRDMSFDLLRSNNNTINITYNSLGSSVQKEIQLYARDMLPNMYRWYKVDPNEKSYKLLDGNIGYITMASIKNEDVVEIREAFKNTKGIIIDIRNYPSAHVPFTLGSYFVSNRTPFVKFTVGNVNNPGEFTFTSPYIIPNTGGTYQGKLIVFVNEVSQSNAEFQAMAYRAGNNTTIIGSTTAGADGNISPITLPGGLRTVISGIGVYYPDGTKTQRIGIVPDIWVEPTIEGVKQGRDELLEKAIEVINNQ